VGSPVSISATIITHNEERHIAEAIASLSCCDEVVVVDSGSTDRTREIAAHYGARVIERAWDGYSRQKNFAAEQSHHDWILSVDADERVSVELANSIARWKCETNGASAASMPRRAFYLGKWVGHSGWYPDRKLRLYDRRSAQWSGDFVHETLVVQGKVDALEGDLLHFPFENWQDHLQRIDRYTQLAAAGARAKGARGSILKLAFSPPISFLRSFILRAGFLDGWRGLLIAAAGARYVFLREFRILR
jgi:glycosyltransferase involved in cell wall biosynthesis